MDTLTYNSEEIQQLLNDLRQAEDIITHLPESALPDDSFLTTSHVCEWLHISPRTLQDYRDNGLLCYYKLEGKILYKRSDIEELLEKNYYKAFNNEM
ncbi:MAG: helix-turn-helix domain-containing protein [Candidatus Azobacteroides sp.]|nr:helix-turn-helix domain-containing protein [Candidatus Azobacteroides sp.]